MEQHELSWDCGTGREVVAVDLYSGPNVLAYCFLLCHLCYEANMSESSSSGSVGRCQTEGGALLTVLSVTVSDPEHAAQAVQAEPRPVTHTQHELRVFNTVQSLYCRSMRQLVIPD